MTTTFEYTEVRGYDSEAIQRAAWNENTQRLLITFTGGNSAIYSDFDHDFWQDFNDADSKGHFYNTEIKGELDSEVVHDTVVLKPADEVVDEEVTTTPLEQLNQEFKVVGYASGGLIKNEGASLTIDNGSFKTVIPNVSLTVSEPVKTLFVIHYNFNTNLTGSAEVRDTNESNALLTFYKQVEDTQASFPDLLKDVKVTKVVHYFE